MALLKSRGSKHTRNLRGLIKTNTLATQSLGSVTGVMTSLATISSSFALIWFRKASGKQRGGCTTEGGGGGTALSMTM